VGITDPFCVRLIAVGEAVQEGKDVIRSNLLNLALTEILAESFNNGLIRSQGIFFFEWALW
jgi:hypothetical protein